MIETLNVTATAVWKEKLEEIIEILKQFEKEIQNRIVDVSNL